MAKMETAMRVIASRAREMLLAGAPSGHDYAHVWRVRSLCQRLVALEKADVVWPVLEAAALLHDLGREHERRDPSVDHAAQSAEMAGPIMAEAGFPEEHALRVLQAIRAHRFSSRVVPESLEGKLLQDADRIDISGAIGIAMTFAHGGAHGRALCHPDDPFAKDRALDDGTYSLDHFYTKILTLADTLHTESARTIAQERAAFTRAYLEQLRKEIAGTC